MHARNEIETEIFFWSMQMRMVMKLIYWCEYEICVFSFQSIAIKILVDVKRILTMLCSRLKTMLSYFRRIILSAQHPFVRIESVGF
jgi:hypothetical protein